VFRIEVETPEHRRTGLLAREANAAAQYKMALDSVNLQSDLLPYCQRVIACRQYWFAVLALLDDIEK
jgi:hypothetical protein